MSQEDKLKEAKRLYETANADQRYVLESLFPELKESEDERTRKEIVRFIRMEVEDEIVGNKWLAWLEKQSSDDEKYQQGWHDALEKQGKSAIDAIKLNHTVDNNEMVESMFKAGDWVVRTDGENFCNGSKYAQITKIDNWKYWLDSDSWVKAMDIRLWSIEDAKDGDVLEFEDHGRLVTGIVSFVNKTTGKVYVSCLLEDNKFKIGVFYNLDTVKPHPATKEQRNFLERAMTDAGYIWNSEKKEPIRI